MTTIKYFVLTAAAALVLTACAGNAALAAGANAANTAARPSRAAPTKDALVTL
jgi:hypothetical protein